MNSRSSTHAVTQCSIVEKVDLNGTIDLIPLYDASGTERANISIFSALTRGNHFMQRKVQKKKRLDELIGEKKKKSN